MRVSMMILTTMHRIHHDSHRSCPSLKLIEVHEGITLTRRPSVMWSIVSSNWTEPFCESAWDNIYAMLFCLIGGLGVYLAYSLAQSGVHNCQRVTEVKIFRL